MQALSPKASQMSAMSRRNEIKERYVRGLTPKKGAVTNSNTSAFHNIEVNVTDSMSLPSQKGSISNKSEQVEPFNIKNMKHQFNLTSEDASIHSI